MKRLLIILAIVIALLIGGFVALIGFVPIKQFSETGWYFSRAQGAQILGDASMGGLIRRARIDQFFRPIPGTHRITGIVDIREYPGDEIYLIFYDSLADHSAIIYSCSKTNRSLKWKAVDYNAP